MPRVRCVIKPPLEYLTPGRLYDVRINRDSVDYNRVGPDGSSRGQPGTFGHRWDYAKYIARGDLVLVPDDTMPD